MGPRKHHSPPQEPGRRGPSGVAASMVIGERRLAKDFRPGQGNKPAKRIRYARPTREMRESYGLSSLSRRLPSLPSATAPRCVGIDCVLRARSDYHVPLLPNISPALTVYLTNRLTGTERP